MKKQETLEEAAEMHFQWTENDCTLTCKDHFISGAKWQQERMYSEEEVRKITLDFFYHWWNSKGNNTEQGFDEWFEKLKNK